MQSEQSMAVVSDVERGSPAERTSSGYTPLVHEGRRWRALALSLSAAVLAASAIMAAMVALHRLRTEHVHGQLVLLTESQACSKPMQSCWATRCCDDPTTQCFEKDGGWAECKPHCTPGIDHSEAEELQTPWSCAVVKPGRCSFASENCSYTKCCAESGFQCYEKDAGWAECKHSCIPGIDLSEPEALRSAWTCELAALPHRHTTINRTDIIMVLQNQTGTTTVTSNCTAQSQNCKNSNCCQDAGLTCFHRDRYWAECTATCTPTNISKCEVVAETSTTSPASTLAIPCSNIFENCATSKCCRNSDLLKCYEKWPGHAACKASCTKGSSWSCTVLSQASIVEMSDTAITTPVPFLGSRPQSLPTLYCFSLMLSYGYEVSLMQNQALKNVGIFECEGHTVFSNVSMQLNSDSSKHISTEVLDGSLQSSFGGPYHAALNSEIFVRVWNRVSSDGEFRRYDWTVKLDPDAVFIASRLRVRVNQLHPDQSMFLDNCASDGLHGPIEVLSNAGMEAYAAGIETCRSSLGQDVWTTYGEDVFLRRCLVQLGITRNVAFIKTLLTEKACTPFSDPMPCISGAVSFHPLKAAWDWSTCLEQAMKMKQ